MYPARVEPKPDNRKQNEDQSGGDGPGHGHAAAGPLHLRASQPQSGADSRGAAGPVPPSCSSVPTLQTRAPRHQRKDVSKVKGLGGSAGAQDS